MEWTGQRGERWERAGVYGKKARACANVGSGRYPSRQLLTSRGASHRSAQSSRPGKQFIKLSLIMTSLTK